MDSSFEEDSSDEEAVAVVKMNPNAPLSVRAQKKWDELDKDGSGYLDGTEVLDLAEWVWCSFRPGKKITSAIRLNEATKIMTRCDENENGFIDKHEFQRYYEEIAADSFKSSLPLP